MLPLALVLMLDADAGVAPVSAGHIVWAAGRRDGSDGRPLSDWVLVLKGRRPETVQGFPVTVEFTHVFKGEDMIREEDRVRIDGREMRRLVVFDGKAGWVHASEGADELAEDMKPWKVREYQRQKAIRAVTNPGFILADPALRLERLPDADVGGTPAFAVRVTRAGVEQSTLFFEKKTLHTLKAAIPVPGPDGARHVLEQVYADFRTVDGCRIAMRMEVFADGRSVGVSTLTSAEFKPVADYPDALFRKPAAPAAGGAARP